MIAGRYELEREIGRGGMGAVWLAQDRLLGRAVAVKRIGHGPGVLDDAAAGRAQREARLAANLNHPHVVSVLDLVTEDDQQWLVMEYVDGVTLTELVRREGPLDPDRAAQLLRQVAEALALAHHAGIVHRDVKPSNMMVTGDDLVKLTDFGIARATGDEALTQTGMVVGSPAYLAPEVVSGRSATSASDVWSLGASFYFALTGSSAYDSGGDLMATLYRIVSEEPPRPANSGWLAPLLAATMAVDIDQRWTMDQVLTFLEPGHTQPLPLARLSDQPTAEQQPGRPATRRSRRVPLLAVLATAVVLAVVAGLGWALLDDDGNPRPSTDGTSSSTPGGSGSEAPAQATAAGMSDFIRTYIATATTDQAAAWDMLTTDFQAQSGSFGRYKKAWRGRPQAEVSQIVADPSNLTVSYLVAYSDAQGRPEFSDRVSLRLEYRDGDYLIAAET